MRKLIFIFLVLTAILVNKSVLAQTEDSSFKDFKLSFMKHFNYPRIMRDSCTATSTVIKVSQIKNNLSITLSDSANELFKQEFSKVSNKLDTLNLKKILEISKGNTSILIPVYFTFDTNYCDNKVNNTLLPISFSRFDGKFYIGNCKLSEPIIIRLTKPVVN